MLAALNTEAPITIRVNTLRCTVHECAVRLKKEGLLPVPGTLSPFALRLPARGQLETLGSYREGWFEVQDEGSQILSMLLRPDPGSRIIAACAGAGGKTMHLGALMQNKGALVAIDPEGMKLKNLQERALRAGVKVAEVIAARHDDPVLDRLHGKGDGVLVDAPCSGLGTVRRNPWLKFLRETPSGRTRTALQLDILRRAALLVRRRLPADEGPCVSVRPAPQALEPPALGWAEPTAADTARFPPGPAHGSYIVIPSCGSMMRTIMRTGARGV